MVSKYYLDLIEIESRAQRFPKHSKRICSVMEITYRIIAINAQKRYWFLQQSMKKINAIIGNIYLIACPLLYFSPKTNLIAIMQYFISLDSYWLFAIIAFLLQ